MAGIPLSFNSKSWLHCLYVTVPLTCKLTVSFESSTILDSILEIRFSQKSRIEYGKSRRESSLPTIEKIMSLSLEWFTIYNSAQFKECKQTEEAANSSLQLEIMQWYSAHHENFWVKTSPLKKKHFAVSIASLCFVEQRYCMSRTLQNSSKKHHHHQHEHHCRRSLTTTTITIVTTAMVVDSVITITFHKGNLSHIFGFSFKS